MTKRDLIIEILNRAFVEKPNMWNLDETTTAILALDEQSESKTAQPTDGEIYLEAERISKAVHVFPFDKVSLVFKLSSLRLEAAFKNICKPSMLISVFSNPKISKFDKLSTAIFNSLSAKLLLLKLSV